MGFEEFDRRDFMKGVGLAVGAGLAGSLPAVAASDRISIAVIGCNGRGTDHIGGLIDLPGAEIAYVCDVDSRAIEKGIAIAQKKQANAPKREKDFRKVLADPSVDAITIAAPDTNSMAKSRSETASIEFSHTPSKPSSFATICRSIGNEVPASAAAPSGSRFNRLRQSASRCASRASISKYASRWCPYDTGCATCRWV